jgi:hypothetical protein
MPTIAKSRDKFEFEARRTEPCPVKPGGGLWLHGEVTPGGSRYCARCDVFFPATYDHVDFSAPLLRRTS